MARRSGFWERLRRACGGTPKPAPIPYPSFRLSRAEVREFDRRAIEEFGVSGVVLMENAGSACAHLIMALAGAEFYDAIDLGIPIVICCGKGNNGGDGFVIARHIQQYDVDLRILLFAPPADLRGDAAVNYRILERSGVSVQVAPDPIPADWLASAFRFKEGGIVVDALFGTGLTGPIRPPLDRVVEAMNAAGPMRFAVDIPSGLDCDTGEPLGPAVRATHTATFVAHKKGFANPAAAAWTGEVHVIDIGAPRALVDEYRRR